jgi:hypothetical protein
MCSPFGTTSKHPRRGEPLSKVEHLAASSDTGCRAEVRGGDINSPGLEAHVVVWRGDNSPSRLCGNPGLSQSAKLADLIVLARVARHLKSPNDDGLDKASQAAQLFSIEGAAPIQKYSLPDMGNVLCAGVQTIRASVGGPRFRTTMPTDPPYGCGRLDGWQPTWRALEKPSSQAARPAAGADQRQHRVQPRLNTEIAHV